MYLKQLVLKGFKSFAVRSALTFEPGLTAIVGPNGSGKSNISDAVLWVLGEQSPKHLRGQAMEDVIFAGSSARKPVSLAEVQLVLDNSDRKLPVEFDEVAITRRIYRSGESEYLINGSPCRLMDVRDILHDTGLGRDAHTIISQGTLDAVIKARPEDRRMLIEEAAGILKHRERKERSARKIKAMDAHLDRVHDLQREVRRQLRPLERQAKRAELHRDLTSQLSDVQLALAVDDLKRLQAQWDGLKAREHEVEAELEITAQTLSEREAELARAQRKLEQHGLFVGDLGEQRRRWQSVAERIDADARLVDEQGNRLREKLATLEDGIKRNRITLEHSTRELAAQQKDAQEVRARLQASEAELSEKSTQLEALRAERRQSTKAYEQLTAQQREGQRALGQARAKLSQANDALANLTFRDGVLEQRAQELDARIEADAAELDGQRERLAEARAAADAAALKLKEAEEQAALLAQSAQGLQRKAADARSARDGLIAEQRALAEVERAFTAESPALSRVLGHREDFPGVVGRISQAFSADGPYEALVEHLLGTDIFGLLTANAGQAADTVTRLLDGQPADKAGQVALMPVSGARPRMGEDDHRQAAAHGSRLLDEVTVAEPYREAAEALLGDVYLVDSVSAGVAAVQALPGRARFVTRDGVVFWPNGKVTAGSAVRSSEGVLARQHRLEQLSELVPQAREAAAAASRAADEAAQKLATSREQASRASREKAQAAGRAESLEREASRFAASLDAERRDRAAIDRQREDLTRQAQAQQPLKSELEQRIQTLEQEAADLEERISVSAQEQRSRLSDEQARERRASELKVEVATLKERQRSLDRRIGELSSSRERAERSLASSAHAERTLGVACGRIGPLLTLLRELGEQAGERVKLVQDRQRLQEASSSSLAEAIAGIRETVDAARTRHNGAVAAQNELKVERARLETKVEAAVQHIVGDLNVPLETALEVRTPVDRQVDEDRARQLAAKIADLGPVNQVAQEEYARLKARDEYISAQVADLEGARKALTRIVNAIDRKMRQSFLETFEVVDASFQEIFSRFFPGGQGSLVLTDPDNPDQTGIELDVQPKGKHIRRTQLMSGGEQALISIALLFAVYRTRSVPFFILDEVEPALDDTNLRRLTGFLDDMRHSTQLIMITHQRRTMELADVLYGVSMQADGVSKLVSQRLDGNGHWVEDPSNNPQAPQGQQSRR